GSCDPLIEIVGKYRTGHATIVVTHFSLAPPFEAARPDVHVGDSTGSEDVLLDIFLVGLPRNLLHRAAQEAIAIVRVGFPFPWVVIERQAKLVAIHFSWCGRSLRPQFAIDGNWHVHRIERNVAIPPTSVLQQVLDGDTSVPLVHHCPWFYEGFELV